MEENTQPFLTDTHCHLASHKFEGEIDMILERARENGVTRLVAIACDIEDSIKNQALSRHFPGVHATAGIHPLYVDEIEDDWKATLEALTSTQDFVAIGEIGLDYFHPPPASFSFESWRKKQLQIFEYQLSIASRFNLPVVIHQRRSEKDVLSVLRNHPEVRAVLHCFSGNREEAETALEMGLWISFTGIVTFPKAPEVREAAAIVPLDRLMVETDAPYLAPVPFRGKRCEPSMVKHTAEVIANLRNMDPDEFASATSQTAAKFFGFKA
ncbi:MAG: TatD family hydrolase [Verrucomicrobiota bacterium]